MSLGHGASIVRSGLVLHLDAANRKSYPGSGTTWSDLSGLSNTGTLINGVTLDNNNTRSLVLDGIDDTISTNYVQTNVTQYTIEIWFNTTATSGLQSLVNNRGTSGSSGKSLTLGLSSAGGGPTSSVGYVFFVLDTDSVGVGPYFTGKTYNDGIWHQLVGTLNIPSATTLNGSNANQYMKLYVDGELLTSNLSYWNAGSATSPFTGLDGTQIGRHNSWNRQFPGKISNVKIYTRDLSASEVRQNFNAHRGRYSI